jgi:ABC-type oligopeptide transport system substrate-binding subunit
MKKLYVILLAVLTAAALVIVACESDDGGSSTCTISSGDLNICYDYSGTSYTDAQVSAACSQLSGTVSDSCSYTAACKSDDSTDGTITYTWGGSTTESTCTSAGNEWVTAR